VLKRKMDSALAGLLLTCSVPLLGFSAIIAKLESAPRANDRPKRTNRALRRRAVSRPRAADEFRSERAIQAYEDLIDATLMERQA